MSDLQDVIATNAIRAYNEGFARGIVAERERIVQLLETEFALYPDDLKTGFSFAIRTINGEQK
jgi:hypothetical protein